MKPARVSLFGDDVFIAYSRQDGADYALGLASRLTRRKLSCFLDQWGTPPGKKIPEPVRKRIRRSSLFVLVGSAGAVRRESVVWQEVEEALKANRRIIPITFVEGNSEEGTLERADWYSRLVEGIALRKEESKALKDATPSRRVITQILNSEGFTRRNRRLQKVAGAIGVTVIVLLAVAAIASVRVKDATAEIKQAQDDLNIARRERSQAAAERDRAWTDRDLAEEARKTANDKARQAETRAGEALKQQRTAERETRRARAERLASASEAELERHPQRSLALAYASIQVLREAGDSNTAAAEQALRRALAGTGGLLLGHRKSVTAVAISPDSHWLATGSDDGTIRLWDLASKSLAMGPLKPPQKPRGPRTTRYVQQISLSADGRWLFELVRNRAWLWDLRAKPPQHFELHGSEDRKTNITAVGFTPDGFRAVMVSPRSVLLWDPATVVRERKAVPLYAWGRTHGERAVPSADFRWIVTSQRGQPPVLLDLTAANPQASAMALPGLSESIERFAVSGNRLWLAANTPYIAGRADPSVYLWDLQGGSPRAPTRLEGEVSSLIGSLDFSPDGRWLALAHDNWALLWKLYPLQVQALTLKGQIYQYGEYSEMAFSPDSKLLATAGAPTYQQEKTDETVRLWDLEAQDPAARPKLLKGYRGPVNSLSFSPDNRWLGVAGSPKAALWSLEDLKPWMEKPLILLLGHERDIGPVAAFSPDSHWFVTGGGDSIARLWDLTTRSWCAAPLRSIRQGTGTNRAVNWPPNWPFRFSDLKLQQPRGGERWIEMEHEGSIYLHPSSIEQLLEVAREAGVRSLKRHEWQDYFPGQPYRRTVKRQPSGPSVSLPRSPKAVNPR
jgi:WD40 repeat protein